CMQGIEYPITF
nr:immunoglobulin light chain junction region [Macaca mulatta]MOW40011.1 immunoglobulin light chain junction region [Macaca mulatta]